LSRIRPERIAALVGVFVAVYLALFAATLWSGVLLAAERGMAAGAVSLMSRLGDPQLRRKVEVSRMGAYVAYDFSISTPEGPQRVKGKHAFHAHNLVLFAALVLATPALSRRRRALALAAGLLAIFAVDTLIVVGDLVSMEDAKFHVATGQNVWPALKSVAAALRYSQPTGGAFMAPVFVWALLLGATRPGPAP
jgi:hypothetical protein